MPSLVGRGLFVGRQPELRRLGEMLAAATAGQGAVVTVTGEPGIGKTRLLAEFGGQVRADGWSVLSGSAYDNEGMPPYLPSIEALRSYVRELSPERLYMLSGQGAAEITLLLPELRALLPDLPTSPPDTPEQERYRLFEAVCGTLEAIARTSETGLLLILDDLHWADTPTLQLLQRLGRRVAGVPALVLVAYRGVDFEPSTAFTETLAVLARQGTPPPLTLARLAALQQQPIPAGKRAPAYPDGLSEREVEVLRLLAAGKSNREIAEALVISINTAIRHVAHIFEKTNVANRTEAAAYAFQHGLARQN